MDLTIESLNSHTGSLGSLRLSDPISLGPSAGKTLATATSKTSIGSSSEAKSPVSIQPAEGNRNIIDEIDEIMENSTFKNHRITQISDQRETPIALAIILKRTSPLAMAMSPTVLKMSGCQD
jgi:hypothetical protein